MTVAMRWIAVLACLVPVCAPVARAGSIWAKAAGGTPRALHSDDTARRTGDMLTIIIAEQSVLSNDTEREMSRQRRNRFSFASEFDLFPLLAKWTSDIFKIPAGSIDISSNASFEGDAEYDTNRRMADRITVTVADVLPNGNLVVVGSRERSVSGDRQVVQVSGVVRPSDITFANTVSSTQVAEFKIVFKHKGQDARYTDPGWLDRLLNVLHPTSIGL